jgi:hypothetical protein
MMKKKVINLLMGVTSGLFFLGVLMVEAHEIRSFCVIGNTVILFLSIYINKKIEALLVFLF